MDYAKAFIQVIGGLLVASGGVLILAGCKPTADAECGIVNINAPIGFLLAVIGILLLALPQTIWFVRFRSREPATGGS